MISLDDPRWVGLSGGRKKPSDPRRLIRALATGERVKEAWIELWDELHHQGGVGEASYASVVVLAGMNKDCRLGWNVYAIAATVEAERHRPDNPPIPDWITQEYREAWSSLLLDALHDLRTESSPIAIRAQIAVVALARGTRKLGSLLIELDESEIDELAEARLAWTEIYGKERSD